MLAQVLSSATTHSRRLVWAARPKTGVPLGAVRLVAAVRVGAVLLLLGFHAVLFWSNIADGRLFEPAVALRWSIGGLLLALLVGLRRIGVPVLWGRRALVVWVLVALLHVGAALPVIDGAITTSTPQDTALTLVVLPPTAGVVFAAGLFLFGALAARGWRVTPAPVRRMPADAGAPLRSRVVVTHLPSRAPPCPVSC